MLFVTHIESGEHAMAIEGKDGKVLLQFTRFDHEHSHGWHEYPADSVVERSFVIPRDHLREVCKLGQGPATCRYIVGQSEGLCCAKGALIQTAIDQRIHLMQAKGDNCEGLATRG